MAGAITPYNHPIGERRTIGMTKKIMDWKVLQHNGLGVFEEVITPSPDDLYHSGKYKQVHGRTASSLAATEFVYEWTCLNDSPADNTTCQTWFKTV